MPLESFKVSKSLTLGVELELQLVNTTDFDLSASASDMLHLLERQPFPGDVKPEITESMIEVATDVQHCHADLLVQLRQMRDVLIKAGDSLNVALCGGGTHPFQQWFHQRIFAKPRFQEVSALYGYLAKQFTVFGQHVHVGCSSADEALFLLHALNRYLPHFIALSASSPYSQGVDTLFDSARLNSVFAFPLSGRAPFILSWDEFASAYFAKMEQTGVVRSMKDFYWDIRPKPEYGTIELRVCDTPLSVERAAALAGYLQVLCAYLLERQEPPPVEDDYLVYNYNRFQACRFGLDGVIVHPRTHQSLPLREDILTTLRRLEPMALDLQGQEALDELYGVIAAGNHSSFLRHRYDSERTLPAVVDAAVARFRQ
ncbi:YbdK family carboxylate-amine ligase [Denitratisoma oestradiolicum]|uniref:Putative glutamate--cysteine ligase 2 n=1 Tax=Denitratisoma oestradiolicum TaxID=311182 RepID=A0A6S6XPY0_9PROT|nr:YbdK family carboxylate-amine ligase [Denitratisoma oestradiolicum]TWO79383.1 glutamate--cysteine ligase [Denitratisoma oestradiolicum]CAB1367996.1 putative glutamate--cysteine ligase 2-1 [Denitratisoma oestradiolicum]